MPVKPPDPLCKPMGGDLFRPRIERDPVVTGLPVEDAAHPLFLGEAGLITAILLELQAEGYKDLVGRVGRAVEERVGEYEDVYARSGETRQPFHVFQLAYEESGLVEDEGPGVNPIEFGQRVKAVNTEWQRPENAYQGSQRLMCDVAVERRITEDQIAKRWLAFFDFQGDLAAANAGITLERDR